jgi:hypothetical protein
MSLLAKFSALNDADLSKLSQRLAALRAAMEKDLKPIDSVSAPVTSGSGLTAEQLIAELTRQKRSAS